MSPILDVRNLGVTVGQRQAPVTIVDDVSFVVNRGEVLGLAGESGSGKTMTALALMGILPPHTQMSGTALFDGQDLLTLHGSSQRKVQGRRLAMVFQDPTSALHPMLTIGRQLTEHMRYHLGIGRREARERAIELLDQVRIPGPKAALGSYPHQFSGGMRQRIQIAIALACEPDLLIADEPTTALDVTIQARHPPPARRALPGPGPCRPAHHPRPRRSFRHRAARHGDVLGTGDRIVRDR